MRTSNERGIAMITTLLVLMLISALLVGFTTVVMSDQRYRFIDRDRGQAFYGAAAGIEKLTADLGNLFFTNVAPTNAQVLGLVGTSNKPSLTGVTFSSSNAPENIPASSLSAYTCIPPKTITTVGTAGYTIKFCADSVTTNPTTISPPLPIKTGPYEGLIALQTPYQLDVTAKTSSGGETHLVRTIESVAIPVFQFGMFSDVDLAFNAADDFAFGGRVHTNGNLFLAEGNGNILTMSDKITAVKDIIRKRLSNGVAIGSVSQTGTVRIWTGSANRDLLDSEGSLTDGLGSSANPDWQTISLSYYNSRLRNVATGAKELKLPLTMVGGSNPDLVKRPAVGENVSNSVLYGERIYSRASLRILLSDKDTDITTLPTVTATAPYYLEGNWTDNAFVAGTGGFPAAYGAATTLKPPVALSPGWRNMTVSSTSGSGPYSITVTAGTGANSGEQFRPTFKIGTTTGIKCTGRSTSSPWQLTGCTGLPGAATVNQIMTVASASGGTAFTVTTTASTALTGTISFGTTGAAQTELNKITPWPMWNQGDDTLITCTGWSSTTVFTGCSNNPANNSVLISAAHSNAGISTIGGYLKIEKADSNGNWTDVTNEILSYGMGWTNQAGTICAEPNANAILRLQRLRDNGGANGGGCNYSTDATGGKDPANWWPNVLFDAREGVLRDSNYPGAENLTLEGLMYYVALDAGNLAKWFKCQSPYTTGSGCTGTVARIDNTGYTVYFSDRRNNRNADSKETGEFGWEDNVNPGNTNGMPANSSPDAGENVNASKVTDPGGVQDLYGMYPNYNGTYSSVAPATVPNAVPTPPAGSVKLDTNARPWSTVRLPVATVNRPILFRRALKLVNGATLAPTIGGLTVASENPVYIQGNWNAATTFGVNDTHAATSVIADAVTILSDNWRANGGDVLSMKDPYTAASRPRATDSYYRVAIVSGKGMIFTKPDDVPSGSTFGTDGGAHSFLRMLEGGGSTTVHYRGSMATFYYNRQATGIFKCCGGVVYSVPTRDYVFDIDFLDPAKLPPNTPVFRDMNAVGFSQDLRPGK